MQLKPRSTRIVALLTGGVIAATTLFHPTSAQAADKSKKLKYGAIGLGVVGAYLLAKGKTVPGAAVIAGGAYAYKKGRDEQKDERYSSYPRNPRYPDYRDGNYRGNDRNDNYGGYNYGNGNYGGYDSGYRSNAQVVDRDRNNREDCRDNQTNGRRDDRRDNRNDNRRDNRRSGRNSGYDLSPYLR